MSLSLLDSQPNAYPMKKSDMVLAIVSGRSEKPLSEKQIRKQLAAVLTELSLNPDEWDQDVDSDVAEGVIKHVGSVRGDLSLQDIVKDIDRILKRNP